MRITLGIEIYRFNLERNLLTINCMQKRLGGRTFEVERYLNYIERKDESFVSMRLL